MKGFSFLVAFFLTAYAVAVDSFDYHCANIALLQDKRVQDEVKITTSQRNEMNKLADANRALLQAYQKRLAGKRPDAQVLNGYLAELKKKIIALMNPAQVKRLRELNLQAAGLMGLLDKDVAMKVGMSNSQYDNLTKTYGAGKGQAESIVRAAIMPIDQKYQKLALPYKGHEAQHQAEMKQLGEQYTQEVKATQQRIQPRVDAITRDTQQKLIAMITPAQKANWTALQGKRFVPPKGK